MAAASRHLLMHAGFSAKFDKRIHTTDGTSDVLVVFITRCRAFLSWAVMNHASSDVSSQDAFYCSSVKADDVDADISQFAVAVLSVIPEDEPGLEGEKAIILEGQVVVDGLPDLPKAVLVLLNLDYPKAMQNTFEFIQRVFVS